MMTSRILFTAVAGILVLLSGCGSNEFNGDKVKSTLEAAPVNLDGEQVSLTQSQVECGVNEELWERPTQVSQERTTARLTQKGRDLKFNDDVVTVDSNYHSAYVQVRGQFSLQVDDVPAIRDDQGTKIADTKSGVKIQHACFQNPLPLMGVKHGNFNADTPVTFSFHLGDNGWQMDKLVH
jgi:hypothetical protein